MIRGITPTQLSVIMEEVDKNHLLITGRNIKYMDATFDFRTLTYFRVLFRPFGKPKEFTVVNRIDKDGNMETGTLFQEIMNWLEEGKTKRRKNEKENKGKD